ncbi:MAG: hypothetical protein ACLS6O_04485 [Bifidobacterium sp.]
MNTQKLMTVAKTMLRMAEQRHLYFWSFHEEDQAVLRSAGVTGEITNDAKNPVTGVYPTRCRPRRWTGTSSASRR